MVRTWRWVALLLSVCQLLTPAVITRIYGEFLSTGATNEAAITPAGWAFSIWGLITLLCAVTCAAVVKFGLQAPFESRVLAEASLVFVGFIAWLLIAAQNWLWLTVAVFAVMVAALIDVMRLLVREAAAIGAPTWLRRLTVVTFGLYLGWSSVAVFANVAAALVDRGWSASDRGWQAAILVAATGAAFALIAFLRATPGYVAAALWALVAVTVGATQREALPLAVGAGAAATLVAVAAVAVTIGRRTPAAAPR